MLNNEELLKLSKALPEKNFDIIGILKKSKILREKYFENVKDII